jgi:hypothetical protein
VKPGFRVIVFSCFPTHRKKRDGWSTHFLNPTTDDQEVLLKDAEEAIGSQLRVGENCVEIACADGF